MDNVVSEYHPYVEIWLGLRYWSGEGTRIPPESGGWLDWDAALYQGLMLIDQIWDEKQKSKTVFDDIHSGKVPQITKPE